MNIINNILKHIIKHWLFLSFPVTVFSQPNIHTKDVHVDFAWGKDVIEHYQKSGDQEKLSAASFLISSMSGHKSPTGESLQEYINVANRCNIPCSPDSLSYYWHKAIRLKGNKIYYQDDTSALNKDFLILHIEQAFRAWRNAPWHKDISFSEFCNYILPYRVSDEIVSLKGREAFVSQYANLIKGETDIIKAFTIICKTMFKRIRQTNSQCPYTLDAHTINYLQQGNCSQRCILLIEVLRSLGIPCTIDFIPVWANYSQSGHSWVAMPYMKQNYTWRERDTIARIGNPIDASFFQVTYHPSLEDGYPYPIEDTKKTAKIYRLCYEKKEQKKNINMRPILFTQRIKDVSTIYNLKDSVTIPLASIDAKQYYLCIFQSGKDWIPIAHAMPSEKSVTFNNIKRGIVYVVATYNQGIINPISHPFLLEETGKPRYFIPHPTNKTKQRIYRKYPIFSQWTNQWGNMIGGTFEGSNKQDFSDADTLATICRMPYGETSISIRTDNVYRYVRYQSTNKSRTPLAELRFYDTTNKPLKGIPISHKALNKSKERVFDGDITTEGYTKHANYWVGLDLGEDIQSSISSINFFPKNDGNFVTRGNFYELFYYENGWHSLGERFSVENFVEYDIPIGALLRLKCDRGNEERIFEYNNEHQIWY